MGNKTINTVRSFKITQKIEVQKLKPQTDCMKFITETHNVAQQRIRPPTALRSQLLPHATSRDNNTQN